MIPTFDIPTTLSVFLVVNVSFTAALLLLGADQIWSGVRYWVTGNVAMLAVLLLLVILHDKSADAVPNNATTLPALLLILSQLLKFLSLLRKPQRPTALLVAVSIIVVALILVRTVDPMTSLNLGYFVAASMLSVLVALQSYNAWRQSRWRRLRGSTLFIVATAALAVYLFAAGFKLLQLPENTLIIDQVGTARTSLLTAVTYFIITHICLVAMLMARFNRIVLATQMRERRQLRLARQAEAHAQEMAERAREKQSLLEVLIHEVRQPLNNAQAALQAVLMDLRNDHRDRDAGRQLQSIIDRVVLSLSNAIVGASVLERRAQSLLIYTDLVSICQLGCSDVGPDWETRINFLTAEDSLFAEADPVLLRLAVRNLIDNALKHSAAGQKVQLTIAVDDEHERIIIRVTNVPKEPFEPTAALFERGFRGQNAAAGGKGLGLYIAQEVAALHHGSLQARVDEQGQTEFALSIPR